jgi:hypothetical protein
MKKLCSVLLRYYCLVLRNCIVCTWYFLPNWRHGSVRRAMILVGSRTQITTNVVYARALCVPQLGGIITLPYVRTNQNPGK